MKSNLKWPDAHVLLLFNIDSSWERSELDNVLRIVEQMKTALEQEEHSVKLLEAGDRGQCLKDTLLPYDPMEHVVLNWCEDLPGIQKGEILMAEMLEKCNFCYTGSPPDVLSLSWNKAAVKMLLDKYGISTPGWQLFLSSHLNGWNKYPAIVKPAFEHCSIGITTEAVVLNDRELADRISYVLDEFRQPALVEDFIDGQEYHVSLWGNERVQMLPPAEIDFSAFENIKDRLCTYDSKFIPGSAHYEKVDIKIPARLDDDQIQQLEDISRRAYHAIGCRDYGRIDLRLQDGKFYVLDINPNADISPDTTLAYAVEAAGLSYGYFASTIVHLAAQRHPFRI